MADSQANPEFDAKVASSLSLLEKYGIAEQQRCDEKKHADGFTLSEQAEERLDALLKKSKGNRCLACIIFLVRKNSQRS